MKNTYMKNPLNYTGGKYKLLPQIIPLLPEKVDTFVDLFGGGFNVGINVAADHFVYNDKCAPVVELLRNFYTHDSEYIHGKVLDIITEYGLSRLDINGYEYYGTNSDKGVAEFNKQQFLKLREAYNKNADWIKFYTIVIFAFNNQIRFNSKGGFNMPVGNRDYNVSMQEKMKLFVNELHKKDVVFENSDFREQSFILDNSFVYADPPYLNACASYNKSWTEAEEIHLLNLLDKVNGNGGKFALSNNLKYDNPILNKWKNKYTAHYLSGNYSNCCYQKKDRIKDCEVLITNY